MKNWLINKCGGGRWNLGRVLLAGQRVYARDVDFRALCDRLGVDE